MMKRNGCCVLALLFCISLGAGAASADDAQVLPKGVFNASLSGRYYPSIDTRFGPDGDEEDVAIDYNANLNSGVFPALALLEAGLGMPPGSASIGSSVVSFDYDFRQIEFDLFYGLTDRVSIGMKVPYWWIDNNVKAELDTSTATVGKNPLFGTPQDPAGVPFIPISLGGVPLTTEDVQDMLGDGLDVNGDGTPDVPGFGFERVEDFSDDTIGDIELGARYQYYSSEKWRLAFTGSVGLPTGETDNIDSLSDYEIGDYAYSMRFVLNNDYTAVKNTVFNFTGRYYLNLPDSETLRVPDDVNQPITINKEKVDRNIGDVLELELSGNYSFDRGFGLSLLYKFGYKWKDSVDGDLGYIYQSLEDETDYQEHVVIAGLSYSTLSLYEQKKFAMPLTAFLNYRNRFAGENLFKSQYWELGVGLYF